MFKKNLKNIDNQEQSDDRNSNNSKPRQIKKSKTRKKLMTDRLQSHNRYSSFQSSSVLTSLAKINDQLQKQRNSIRQQASHLPHFSQKYLPRGATPQQVYQQMLMILNFKQRQIQSLRVYRDELKFISYNNPYSASIKISIKLLQDKADIQSKIKAQKHQIQQEIRSMDIENKNIKQYTQLISQFAEEFQEDNQILDIGKQKEIMFDNIKMQTMHLIKELQDQKRRNNREIKQKQDEIFGLRVQIKQKQDKIRDLKAKVCTLYIKMHSRNNSRGKSKDKNMSMSVRKFNTQKNQTLKQVFIGNTQFKNYSKQLLQKIRKDDQLIKIRFFISKQRIFFQCIYEKREGVLHTYDFDYENTVEKNNEIKSRTQDTRGYQQIYTRYLMSMKFYFRSRLVGVQCRIKTERGNKHIQYGNCQPQIQHQLLTLVNRKLITLGSYWHGKQMIGLSAWYIDGSSLKKIESSKKLQERKKNTNTYQEYFS